MHKKKILSFILSLSIIVSCFPAVTALAEKPKDQRSVYIHAQGPNPQATPNSSTVYNGENVDIYFAVDNPNRGDYENGVHKEPKYDMNGYTVTMYYDPNYFEYIGNYPDKPIDFTVPDNNPDYITGNLETRGYREQFHKTFTETVNGKTYNAVTLTVFFQGFYVPQKTDDALWYNLCKLPLKAKNTGSTQVFIDTSGESEKSIELFAKNDSSDLNEQTFGYTAESGGYHTITIQERTRPLPPTATPGSGSYDAPQLVTLTAEDGCEIWYSANGVDYELYTEPINVNVSKTIYCYALRNSGKNSKSNIVEYNYKILPKSPFLFIDNNGSKELIANIHNENNPFTVYASDKSVFGQIDDGSDIYYTFSDASAENPVIGTNPQNEWVILSHPEPYFEINKTTTVRLMTKKLGEFSEVATYYLGIRPAAPTADPGSCYCERKADVTLSCGTVGAEIYYTTDGSDPTINGILYSGTITLFEDTTLRAASKFDGIYSEISSFYYLFGVVEESRVTAFYPQGVYEGNVYVTLTSSNPSHEILYSVDNGETWETFSTTLLIDRDTTILAKSGDGENFGEIYTFVYKIKPLPPRFAQESTQFITPTDITVFCEESNPDTTDRFDLYYTLDGSDPRIESGSRIHADADLDSADISINKYTVVKAVVLKDGTSYSNVVTNSYDLVSKRPASPHVTLNPGRYTRKIGTTSGFETQFMPVVSGTQIYYTISYEGKFTADPFPNADGVRLYDGQPIEIKGHTIIKAVAVNSFGTSYVGIFEYIITPEAPIAPPSATINGNRLPVVPVSAVIGSTVKYEINGFTNEFLCENGNFYIDTQTGNAYKDSDCTDMLGNENTSSLTAPANLIIKSELDGVESTENRYTYSLSGNPNTLAAPYADKGTGEYEEIAADSDNNLIHIKLYSLNSGSATIQYKLNNSQDWIDYDGSAIKIKNDTVLQTRCKQDDNYSAVSSYVYTFVPLAPVITLASGRYVKGSDPVTYIEYDPRAPQDKIDYDYRILYRQNGDPDGDVRYSPGTPRTIKETTAFKAYVKNTDTDRVSKNTVHYYIIEPLSSAYGSVYVASPYDVSRISAAVLDSGEYAKGIKLLSINSGNAKIHYYYTYTIKDGDTYTTSPASYDNIPITVNPLMTNIKITAWLENDSGRVDGNEYTHEIEFVHLNTPKTSLDSSKVEFPVNTEYTFINDYPNDENILLYYTLDGSDPTDESNANRKLYGGETLKITGAVTVKAVYMSACGTCVEKVNCINKVYGPVGEYKYTTPTVISSGGSSGGGGSKVIDNTRKYTKDIFGNEHPTHISYISGYPDGSVKPDGKMTREEMTSVLYRITNHEYEKPFIATGEVFPDVNIDRWSALSVEYMAEKEIVSGYPDGEFKPQNNLTRAEFAALICRFAKFEKEDYENPFTDLDDTHWAYENILTLVKSGIIEGYEDNTFKPENEITRAEVMTVINKLLGRTPSDSYLKTLDFNPYTDLLKDKWYYSAVLEATVTHDYYLDNSGVETKWENCK